MHDALILWDVVEEHLDEAEFLFEMWERAVVSPEHSWRDVERSFGERLRAHLDGLAIAGEPAVRRLLAPALADGDTARHRATACALALLEDPSDAGVRRVLRALADADKGSELAAGLARALAVSNRHGLDDALREALYAGDETEHAALLEALSARGVDAGPIVTTLLRADDGAVVAAALRAAAMRPADDLRGAVMARLDDRRPAVASAAVETGLVWGLREAWARCLDDARRGDAVAVERVAMLGGLDAVGLVREALLRDETRLAAVRALGFTGAHEAADACLHWMTDGDARVAKVAADSFGAITGVDAFTDGFSVKEDDDDALPDLDDDLAKPLATEVEDGLPRPAVEAFVRWFHEHGARFERGRRYLRGRAMTREVVMDTLRDGPMRLKASLARGLWLRGGVPWRPPRLGVDLDARALVVRSRFER